MALEEKSHHLANVRMSLKPRFGTTKPPRVQSSQDRKAGSLSVASSLLKLSDCDALLSGERKKTEPLRLKLHHRQACARAGARACTRACTRADVPKGTCTARGLEFNGRGGRREGLRTSDPEFARNAAWHAGFVLAGVLNRKPELDMKNPSLNGCSFRMSCLKSLRRLELVPWCTSKASVFFGLALKS